MNCTNCNHLNLPQAAFCGECGMHFNTLKPNMEKNTSSLDNQITESMNYNQLVEMKSMNKLPKTTLLNIVQVINYLTILGILFMAFIFIVLASFFGDGSIIIFIIIATIILLLIMIYFIRGLNRYDNQTKIIYLILPVFQALLILIVIIDDFEISLFPSLIFPGIIIYALVYHKPTSDYFKL